MRRPVPEIREQTLLALRLGAQLQNLLLPQEIDGQGRGDGIGELFGSDPLEIAEHFGEKERVAGFVGLDESLSTGSLQREITVFQVIDLPLEQRVAGKQLGCGTALSPWSGCPCARPHTS